VNVGGGFHVNECGDCSEPKFASLLTMKTHPFLVLAAGAAMLPGLVTAARKGKSGSRHGGHHGGAAVEALNSYDKNANHRIDADELPLLQKAFSAMRTLDKNADGQIDPSEADSIKAGGHGKAGHTRGQLRKADKNGNRKIDSDEIAALQNSLAGTPAMSRLDRNNNGKLDENEIDRVNKRLEHGGKRKGRSSVPPTPAPEKAPSGTPATPEKAEKTDEKKGDVDPFLPSAKPGGNAAA
jgi:Ca2+-binding EF-hand superfamily protein